MSHIRVACLCFQCFGMEERKKIEACSTLEYLDWYIKYESNCSANHDGSAQVSIFRKAFSLSLQNITAKSFHMAFKLQVLNDIQISCNFVFFQQANNKSTHGKKANHREESCKILTYTYITAKQYTYFLGFFVLFLYLFIFSREVGSHIL